LPSISAAATPNAEFKLSYHSQGAVHVAFLKKESQYGVVTLGSNDNTFMIHTIEAL
jgi:hypothetical protein